MGIYTLSVTNGPHVAPIAGGYITQRLGWRWCFWIPAIIQGALWVLLVFTLPETLFSREDYSKLEKRSYTSKLLYHGKVLDRPIRARDFGASFRMIKYVAVTLPCIYYCTANTYGSALFAVTGSHLSAAVYKFNTEQTGLFMGVPLTIGCAIGEATAGWVSDVIINAYARRHNGYRKPEARLFLIPLCTLLCIGTATYGYCIQHAKPWITSAICMAVAGLETQVGTTVVYTYCTDSYKPQSGEIGAIINLFKSGMSPLNPRWFDKKLTYILSLCVQHWVLCSAFWREGRLRCGIRNIGCNQCLHADSSCISHLQGGEDQGKAGCAEGTSGLVTRHEGRLFYLSRRNCPSRLIQKLYI